MKYNHNLNTLISVQDPFKIYSKIYIPDVDNIQCTETCHEGVGEMHRS